MKIYTQTLGHAENPLIVWAHGWGQSHKSFVKLAESLGAAGQHVLIDFPGFGNSPPPPEPWGSAEYADFIAGWLKENAATPVIWIGHSFGGRVGIHLAARYPQLIAKLGLIASAGLPRQPPLHIKIVRKARIYLYKFLKKLIPFGLNQDWLMAKFGSRDYKNAGAMRESLVKVVNENLSEQARRIACPTFLIYGENDSETPPEIGQRLHRLIKGSELIVLPGQDHYSVLSEGRHQIAHLLEKFFART